MDDLVKHLRNAGRAFVDNEYNLHARAADRIEQLETTLREIYELPSVRMDESGIIARAALPEE